MSCDHSPLVTANAPLSHPSLFRRLPLLFPTLLFITGILLHRLAPAPLVGLIALLILITLALILEHRSHQASLVIAFALFTTGALAAQLDAFYFPQNHIGLFTTEEPCLATLEVRLDENPKILQVDRGRKTPPTQAFNATVERIRTWKGWEYASGEIQISVGQVVENLTQGSVVRLTGMLQQPLRAANPGQTDWFRANRQRRLLAELRVPHASGVRVLAPAGVSPLARVRLAARALLDKGFEATDPLDGQLLQALLFGDRPPALKPIENNFRQTGTSHLLASSGLRIAILAGCIYLLGALLCVAPRLNLIMTTSVVALFALTTSPAPQAIRPVLLCIGVGLAISMGRHVNPIQLLCLAAFIILAISPLDLYSPSFQLSFVTVLGIMLLVPPAQRWADELRDPDTVAAGKLLEMTWSHRFRRLAFSIFRNLALVSLIAWLVSAPLVAYRFEQFNPWSIPVGLLLSPLVFLALVAGFAKIALTAILPSFSPFLATVAAIPAMALRHGVATFAHLPFANVEVTSPPLCVMLLYYALLGLPAVACLDPIQKLRARCIATHLDPRLIRWGGRLLPASSGLALLITVGTHLGGLGSIRPALGTLRLTLLSVGAGQCAVLETPDDHAFVFDCGSSTLADTLSECLEPFLRHEARTRVDALFLSHTDYDHISAAASLDTQFGVHAVYISPEFRTFARDSITAKFILSLLDDSGNSPKEIFAGQSLALAPGVTLDVLWPPARSKLNSNNTGLVLKLTYAGRSILLPADIQIPPEQALLTSPQLLDCDVLVAPHHGSAENTTARFIQAAHPSCVISSNATRLTKKQRSFDALPNIHPFFRTSRCGALTITIDSTGKLKVTGFTRTQDEPGSPTNKRPVPSAFHRYLKKKPFIHPRATNLRQSATIDVAARHSFIVRILHLIQT